MNAIAPRLKAPIGSTYPPRSSAIQVGRDIDAVNTWDLKLSLVAVTYAGFVMAGYFKGATAIDSLSIDLTLLLAVLVVGLVGVRVVQSGFAIRTAVLLCLGLFLLLALPMLWTPTEGPYAHTKVLRFFTLTLLAAIAPLILVRNLKEAKHFVNAFLSLGILHSVEGVLTGAEHSEFGASRLEAFGANPIHLGRSSGMALLIVLILLSSRHLSRVVGLISVGMLIYALVASGSRGPFAAVGITMISTVLLTRHRLREGARLVAIAVLLIVGASYALSAAPQEVRSRTVVLVSGRLDSSSAGRVLAWQQAWDLVKNHPSGLGWGSFPNHTRMLSITGRYDSAGRYETTSNQFVYPHNILLELAAELGWQSALLVAIAFVLTLVRLRRVTNTLIGQILFACVLFFLLNAQVSGDLNDNRILFAFLGLGWSVIALMRRGRPKKAGSLRNVASAREDR